VVLDQVIMDIRVDQVNRVVLFLLTVHNLVVRLIKLIVGKYINLVTNLKIYRESEHVFPMKMEN
jgi:hypothetical protein